MKNRTPILTTKRLSLYEFHPEDAALFFNLNNDPVVMQYTGDVPFDSLADTHAFIQDYDAYARHGFGRWTVIITATQTPIGWCGLKQHPNEMIDLGYRFLREFWSKGYATEAAQASVQYGFETLQLDEIVGRTAEANKASIRVLEKIGMKFWKNAPCEGIENSVYYRINRHA